MSYKKEYEIRLEDLGASNVATDIAILKILEDGTFPLKVDGKDYNFNY